MNCVCAFGKASLKFNMNEESTYLLKVLKSFIQNANPGAFNGDWHNLIRLANIHSVIGILGYMVIKYPNESNAHLAEFMKKQYLKTVALLSMRDENMKSLIHSMNACGIDHLIFKGYIVKNYYPIPELRTFGDIDFLIHPKDRSKSDELMLQQGFERKTDWEPVFSYQRANEYYEIHTDIMEVDVSDKADYKEYFNHVWEHAHLTDEHTYELSPEFHFLYLLTHIAKHISGSGAGIRMYMDIAVFMQHFGNKLDWKYIQAELKKLAFSDFANMVLTVVNVYFGVDVPINLNVIDEQVLEDFMGFTMSGGTFGFVGRDSGLISLKKQKSNKESISRVSVFADRLFPSAASIESRYTYLQGHHWLLPVAWVHRFIRTKDTWGSHAKEAQSILNTDTEEVLKLKRIYKEIGL